MYKIGNTRLIKVVSLLLFWCRDFLKVKVEGLFKVKVEGLQLLKRSLHFKDSFTQRQLHSNIKKKCFTLKELSSLSTFNMALLKVKVELSF